MEQLFSTVAQISFTVVGLFFVALTVDSDSRKFWFGKKPQSQYAYLNLLVMLLPGLFALGGLINLGSKTFPSWPIVALLLCIFSIWIRNGFKELERAPNYKMISEPEAILESPKFVNVEILFLLFLSIFGTLANVIGVFSNYIKAMEIFVGVFLFFSVAVSILPVYVFLRVRTKNKKRKKRNKDGK